MHLSEVVSRQMHSIIGFTEKERQWYSLHIDRSFKFYANQLHRRPTRVP